MKIEKINKLSNIILELRKNFKFSKKLGFYLFSLGVFFLASAPALALIFLLISSIIGTLDRKENYFSDKYNYAFILLSLILLSSCIFQSIRGHFLENSASSSWIGLLNWIPFFWFFWGFQPYLSSHQKRIRVSVALISGTFPLIISGFCQYFFKLYGPYETLNGIIIWYQRSIDSGSGLTGLFNNQNYAGAWLSIVLPFTIFFSIKNKYIIYKTISIVTTILFSYTIVLTNSRGAIFSIFLSIRVLSGFQIILFMIALVILILIICGLYLIPIVPIKSKEIIELIFPTKIFNKISIFKPFELQSYPRLEIWNKTIKFIKINPLIGYGAGSFPFIYKINNGIFEGHQHPHNLFLQIAYNYGVPASITLLFILFLILYNSQQSLKKNKDKYVNLICDKTWQTSLLIFFVLHLFDTTYFDGRISMIFWILLAANRCIIQNNKVINSSAS